ncbi:hypothetical protein [Streptomyces sp. NPDC000410]|uniref:hypothetical protein n=1 Tax=Streptomyces sp. NPDC000410 TaxID=3154254 RepID=UPI00332E76DB
MSTDSVTADAVEHYAYLWQTSPYPVRWAIWNTVDGTMVFDRQINCPVGIDDEATLREIVSRMREAGVPESDDYPGRPCG